MFGYSTGLSALATARLALQTIGHNLANATTPGYSRQRVDLATSPTSRFGNRMIGGGVEVAGLQRVSDDLLTGQVRLQQQAVGRRSAIYDSMLEIESLYGEPGAGGFASRLGDFFNGLSALSTNPDDSTQRVGVVQDGVTMTGRLRQIRDDLSRSADFVRDMSQDALREVNRLGDSLAEINRELARSQGASGSPPSGLLDRQAQLLDGLSDLVDIGVLDAGGGRVNITVGGQMLVSNDQTQTLTLGESDGKIEVHLSGSPHAVDVRGGRLRGLLDLDDGGASGRAQQLDDYARALILNFNRVHTTGIPADGGYTALQAEHAFVDSNGDGSVLDERLADAGLPFDVSSGQLLVSVMDEQTGQVNQELMSIDPATDTVADIVAAFNGISGLGAHVDASGMLSLNADAGTRFHFAAAIDPNPASLGGFGNVGVKATGAFTGSADETLTFQVLGTGDVGVTPGLQVEVLDSSGVTVATLDIGDTYSPGDDLAVAMGLSVSFGPGGLDQGAGDSFSMNLVADSDSSDLLVALGLGGFFQGVDARDIDVRTGLLADSSQLSAAMSDATGDNTNILRLLALRSGGLDDLGGLSIEEHYNSIIGDVGMETSRAELNRDTEALLLGSVQNRLEQVRGVSVDEELADLQRFEQAYQAAARYLTAIDEVTQVLFSI